MLRVLLVLLCLAAPALADIRDLTGTAFYREKIALEPGALLEVQLLEEGGEEEPVPISSLTMQAVGATPFPFRLTFDDAMIREDREYALVARIQKDGVTLFRTEEAPRLFTGAARTAPEILLVKAEPEGGPPQPRLRFTEWLLATLAGGETTGSSPARLMFREEAAVDGSGGCNEFTTSYRVDEPDGLSFGKIAATLRGCSPGIAQQERLVFKALAETRTYRIENGELVLYDEDGTERLRFEQTR